MIIVPEDKVGRKNSGTQPADIGKVVAGKPSQQQVPKKVTQQFFKCHDSPMGCLPARD
jgi:hypothetical protein